MQTLKQTLLAASLVAGLGVSGLGHAIAITASSDASTLAGAVATSNTLTVLSSALSGHTNSSGTYTNATNTYGIGPGIVISSGNVNDYNDGPNTVTGKTTNFGVNATVAQEALLDPITGGSLNHRDVTQLDISFTTKTGSVFFLVTFGSDEYPEFKNSSYIDAFGLYLNGTNIAFFNGNPININHPDMTACPGTELDGVLTCDGPMLFSANGLATDVTHTLTFIIADSGDNSLDSTAYIAGLGGENPVPEPATLALLGLGLTGLAAMRRRKSA